MKGRFKDDYAKKPAGQQFIDIFGYREERTAAKADEQETAYLWSLVAKLKNVRGVIGGRSGSLDIAAFMGVRTLSWDIVDEDAEYFRMLLAYPLMSCCRRAGIEEEGRPGTEDEPSGELNKGLLEPLALALWLQGREVIPEHGPSNPLPRKVVEKELEFEPLHYLDWMLDSKRGAGDEQAASAEAADGDDMADDDDKTDDDEEIHERKSEKKSDDDKAKKAKVADDGQKAEKGK
jgi:hypothetical protein